MEKIGINVGDNVAILLPDATLIGKVQENLPDGTIRVITNNGAPVLVDPNVIKIRILENTEHSDTVEKEEASMGIGTATIHENVERRKKVIDITEEAVTNASRFHRVLIPAVSEDGRRIKRQVEVAIRKITETMAKMDVRDELGTVTFTVMASKRDPGDLYIPDVVKSVYKTKEGELKEAVVVDITGKPNELLTAIARAILRAEGITLGGNTLESIF